MCFSFTHTHNKWQPNCHETTGGATWASVFRPRTLFHADVPVIKLQTLQLLDNVLRHMSRPTATTWPQQMHHNDFFVNNISVWLSHSCLWDAFSFLKDQHCLTFSLMPELNHYCVKSIDTKWTFITFMAPCNKGWEHFTAQIWQRSAL